MASVKIPFHYIFDGPRITGHVSSQTQAGFLAGDVPAHWHVYQDNFYRFALQWRNGQFVSLTPEMDQDFVEFLCDVIGVYFE